MLTRTVSLLPAGTDILAVLGALDSLVGVTHECDWPAEVATRPRVTANAVELTGGDDPARIDAQVRELSAGGQPMFALLADRIMRLQPTLLLTQALCDVCAVSETDVRALAARLQPVPHIVTLAASTLDGVMTDILRVAAALGIPDVGESIVRGLRERIQRVEDAILAAGAPRPRVAVIEWTDPPYPAGHWVPEMVELAGGMDVLSRPGEHSTPRPVSAIEASRPDVIVFAPCGYTLSRAADEANRTLQREEWRWAAACEVWAIDGNSLTSRPGPRLVDGVETLAAIFHPEILGDPRDERALRL